VHKREREEKNCCGSHSCQARGSNLRGVAEIVKKYGTCVVVALTLITRKLSWEKESDNYRAKVDMTVCNTWEFRMNKRTPKLESTPKTMWERSVFFFFYCSQSMVNESIKDDMALTWPRGVAC
jgi:hypothetical protein